MEGINYFIQRHNSFPHEGEWEMIWDEPQLDRCDRGWEVGRRQHGCLARATTDVVSGDADLPIREHLCDMYALITTVGSITDQLRAQHEYVVTALTEKIDILNENLNVVGEALGDINYTLMPWHRKARIRIGVWIHRRRRSLKQREERLGEGYDRSRCPDV